MFEPTIVLAVAGTFLLAGIVKGVIGMGLPTVSLALLTLLVDLPSAMVLLLVPSFVTNVWQAMVGGHVRSLMIRLWPFFLGAVVCVWIGAIALTRIDLPLLSALLGIVLVIYALVSLFGFKFSTDRGKEIWVGPLSGIANGVLTGMTGSAVVPGVMYLQSIGLARDALIQAMGMLFALSALALAFALQNNNLLTNENAILSTAALIPAIIGMTLGQKIRKTLSETVFRKVFFFSVLFLGLYIAVRSIYSVAI